MQYIVPLIFKEHVDIITVYVMYVACKGHLQTPYIRRESDAMFKENFWSHVGRGSTHIGILQKADINTQAKILTMTNK